MASRSRKKCDFYARGNCRKGDQCKFLHENPVSVAALAPSPSRGRANPRGTSSSRPALSTPRQVCHVFWQSGTCDRGFDCSFKHTRDPQATNGARSFVVDGEEESPDFYSIEGLVARGRERPQQGSYDPAEVHNHIKPFLKDNYVFGGAMNIQSFVRIISSVNDRNKSWVRVHPYGT